MILKAFLKHVLTRASRRGIPKKLLGIQKEVEDMEGVCFLPKALLKAQRRMPSLLHRKKRMPKKTLKHILKTKKKIPTFIVSSNQAAI